jgi:hypothetical protein
MVRGQAFYPASGDCFKVLAFALLACLAAIPFCRKANAVGAGAHLAEFRGPAAGPAAVLRRQTP